MTENSKCVCKHWYTGRLLGSRLKPLKFLLNECILKGEKRTRKLRKQPANQPKTPLSIVELKVLPVDQTWSCLIFFCQVRHSGKLPQVWMYLADLVCYFVKIYENPSSNISAYSCFYNLSRSTTNLYFTLYIRYNFSTSTLCIWKYIFHLSKFCYYVFYLKHFIVLQNMCSFYWTRYSDTWQVAKLFLPFFKLATSSRSWLLSVSSGFNAQSVPAEMTSLLS